MDFIRITTRCIFRKGLLMAEHLYVGDDIEKAKRRFLREYPEHKDCCIIAEHYDSSDEKNAAHFKACSDCDCVHYW